MGKLVMNYWDCPFCGSKEIRGDVVSCPSCGRARGDVTFYMKNYSEGEIREENERDDIEYVDEEKAKEINRNPDWYCSFCNSLNSDSVQVCGTCGATRADSESNYFDQLKKRREQEAAEYAAQHPAAPAKRRNWIKIILPVVLILAALFFWLNHNQTPGKYRVVETSWSREIQIVVPEEKTGEGWDLPNGANETNREKKFHYMTSVVDHYDYQDVERSRQVIDYYETYYTYEDLGNGYSEEVAHRRPVYKTEYYTETVRVPVYAQVPVYDIWYSYTYFVDIPARPPVHSEGNDQNPVWPETNLTGDELEGERTEIYRITIEDEKGNQTVYHLDESAWNQIHKDDEIEIVTKRILPKPYIKKDGKKIADIEKN